MTIATAPSQFSTAQWTFIKKVRGKVEKDHVTFFKENNWRNIYHSGGQNDSNILNDGKKVKPDSFYVKAVAVWVPHLLFKNHTPCCPYCKKNSHVNVNRSRWINTPKLLFGVHCHKYLDTVLYPCSRCCRKFAGYNKQSMQLDASLYHSYFNFYLGSGYAIDSDLFRHIIEEAATEATATIATRLKKMAYDSYFADHSLYLSAVGRDKIERRPQKRTRIDDYLQKASDDIELQDLRDYKARKEHELGNLRLNLSSARARLESDVELESLIPDKDNHNKFGSENKLPGLGKVKIRRLPASSRHCYCDATTRCRH